MKRNKFSLSNYKLASFQPGELVPCGMVEVLPGDTIQQATSALVRFGPMLAPVMHPTHATIHHWFVPHRLVWEDWEKFITGGMDGMDASVFPTITFASGVAVGSLGDYLGIPTGVNGIEVSALPFRAYALIYNEWYRDEDLVTELVIDKTSGPDTTTNTTLQMRAWEKDYFTSARPFEQKGPSITIPIGTRANVKGIGTVDSQALTVGTSVNVRETDGVTTFGPSYLNDAATPALFIKGTTAATSSLPDIYADLTNASAITVTALREALGLQRYEEARARFGSRYTEYLRYYGIHAADARLQRPEYLGGGKQTVQFSEVLATAETDDTPIGSLKGHGIGALRSNRYRRFIEEHGYILTFINVQPRTMYVQGLPRTWNRRTKEDFHTVELEHIGQQEILYKELYAAHSTPNDRFGWQDRYDEYRRQESTIAGEFRTSTLDFWHQARIFSSDPALNATFVKSNPTNRIFADQTGTDNVLCMIQHSVQARRQLSSKGTSFIF